MVDTPDKKCTVCKNMSPPSLGKDDDVNGFTCIQCYMSGQTKANKKYKHEEFIRTKLPILSIIITSTLSSFAIIIAILAFYR